MNVLDLLQQAIRLQEAGQVEEAIQIYTQVLQQQPRLADAHHLLGCAYQARHQTSLAIQSISTAIAITPQQAIFYNNLGTNYLERQEHVAAEMCFRHALTLDPAYADACSNLGLALSEQNRLEDACQILETGCARFPAHPRILCNLANLFARLHRHADALSMAEQSLTQFASGYALIAKVSALFHLNRMSEALALVDQVMERDSDLAAQALQLKGGMLEIIGNMDEACATYDRGLELAPESVELLFARGQCRKVSKDEVFFKNLMQLEAVATHQVGPKKTQLYYALGKAHQDTGDIAAAAAAYAVGAANQLQVFNYDEQADAQVLSVYQEVFTTEYLDKLSNFACASSRPVFIVGMPRSGTTLIEQILASHPDVFAAGELNSIAEVSSGLELPGGWRLNRQSEASPVFGIDLAGRAQMYLDRVDGIPGSRQKTHFTDKMPENFLNIGVIAAMFPNAKIIHCRRDPVDTCISCYNTLFANQHYWSYDFGMLARFYRRYWNLMEHWRKVLPGRFLELRYEQTIDDTEGVARQLLDWCGLPWDDKVLRFYETDRPVTTASVTQVRQPIYNTSSGRWKKWTPHIQPLLAGIDDIESQYWAEVGK